MTADTYSNSLGYLVMGTGNDNNTWGGNANTAVFQTFEDAIANALTSTVTGGTLDLSGSPPPAAASQARYAALIFNGTLGSNQVVQVPNLSKYWWVQNATAGAFTLKIKTPAGTASTAIPQNSGWQLVLCDGANGITVSPFNTKQIQMPDGTLSLPAFSNINETNSGWYRFGTQDWRFVINGSAVLQVTGAGAASPSIVNVLSPNALQIAGQQVIPPGTELAFAGIALPSGYLWEDGAAYSRATYAALFAALSNTQPCNTNGNTTISSIGDIRFNGLIGAFVEGTGIPTGTTITAIGSNTLTISQAAVGSNSITLRIIPHGQGDGSTTFNVPDRRGRVLIGRDDEGGTVANRITTAGCGIDGTSLHATGGEQTHTLTVGETPAHSHTFTGTPLGTHTHSYATFAGDSNTPGGATNAGSPTTGTTGATSAGTPAGTNSNTGGGGAHNIVQPAGITNWIIKT